MSWQLVIKMFVHRLRQPEHNIRTCVRWQNTPGIPRVKRALQLLSNSESRSAPRARLAASIINHGQLLGVNLVRLGRMGGSRCRWRSLLQKAAARELHTTCRRARQGNRCSDGPENPAVQQGLRPGCWLSAELYGFCDELPSVALGRKR